MALLGFAAVASMTLGCPKGGEHAKREGHASQKSREARAKDKPRPPSRATAEAKPAPPAKVPSAEERYETGAVAYATYCALCHGPSAEGYAADHAPSLVSPTFLASASDDFLSRAIREGRPNTAMAGYAKFRGGPLSDEEITSIIAFVRAGGSPRARLATTVPAGYVPRGATVYATACSRCHGTPTERGDAVHLANPNLLGDASDGFLRYAIENGRPGTPMPRFAGVLSEGDIDDVVALLRSWAPPAPRALGSRPDPPPLGEFILHPGGKNPDFQPKSGRFIPIDEVKKALDEGKRMVIIDARATSDWFSSHVPGSISVPYYAFDRLDAMPKDGTWILAYCACPHHASGVVVDELKKRGYEHTAILDEGILAWQKRGYPVDREAPPPNDSGAAATN